jgi:hypothetical protein
MFSSTDSAMWSVDDGTMSIQLDSGCVNVPSELFNKSQILLDALSVTHTSGTKKVTLAAPKEWLQAWAVCYCNDEENISSEDTTVLVNCLLVCFFLLTAAPIVPTTDTRAVSMFSACRVLGATLIYENIKVLPTLE